MNLIRKIKNKQTILLGVFFVLFSLSYTTNLLRITEPDLFHYFERQPEGLVIGRLIRASQDGAFSYGGLTGINYDSKTDRSTEQYAADLAAQHNIYITNQEAPDSFFAYKSQSGGQGIILSAIQSVLPFNNTTKLMLFRGINALLVAFVFILFGRWIYNRFDFIASFTTLLLILLSSWLNMYAHNLWWVLWNFYLPFLTMLLLLEYRHKNPEKVSDIKIFIYLFLAVFLKCFFTGFEFITTTLAAAICPIVYYFYLERKSFVQFIVFSVKASICMIAAVLAQMVMLVTQIRFLEGSYAQGVNHIINSFTKRTEAAEVSHLEVIKMYLQGDAFNFGFSPNNIQFYFGGLILVITIIALFVYFKEKKDREKTALIITFVFSIIAPLSWLIIFKQHSFEHPHMDYIIWYMPFLLYGFSLIGVAISWIFSNKKAER